MTRRFPAVAIASLLATMSACERPAAQPDTSELGRVLTGLEVQSGGIWESRRVIRADAEDYVVFLDDRCAPTAKVSESARKTPICARRISPKEFSALRAAMEPYRENATPLSKLNVAADSKRPDGKACKTHLTDQTFVSLSWQWSEGAEIVGYDLGCDADEFAETYKKLRAVTDVIPLTD